MLLKDFNKYQLDISAYDCIDRTVFHIDYKVECVNKPFSMFILSVWGCIVKENECKYLIILESKDDKDYKEYKKMLDEIVDSINNVSSRQYSLDDSDYTRIKLNSIGNDEQFDKLPIGVIIYFTCVTVSNRLAIGKDNKLVFETYLQQCFYETYKNDTEIVEDKE